MPKGVPNKRYTPGFKKHIIMKDVFIDIVAGHPFGVHGDAHLVDTIIIQE